MSRFWVEGPGLFRVWGFCALGLGRRVRGYRLVPLKGHNIHIYIYMPI